MAPRFGTDGVRGVANTVLTPSFALDLGRAAARVLRVTDVVIGADTRRSGGMLQAAFAAGLASEGVTAHLMGIVPTPAVAHVAAATGFAGAMISASHNPFPDNGIKLFAPGGSKLPDDVEAAIEAELAALQAPVRTGREVGVIVDAPQMADGYRQHLVSLLPSAALAGRSLVLDTGNGAAAAWAGSIYEAAGADVHVIFDSPDGANINDGCGATHPEDLRRVVVERGADLGLAFDGDADRLIAVDHTGTIVDGDHVMAILALDMKARGVLRHDTVVVTVMTNLGFKLAMAEAGVKVAQTAVGDRYVLQAMDEGGFSLGGEQSGHVIFRDVASTGDGMLTGLMLADVVARSGRTLAELANAAMTRLPQVLINHRMAAKDPTILARLQPYVDQVDAELAGRGRVLVRESGTEPLVRVMVEAPDAEQANRCAMGLIAQLRHLTD